MFLSFHAHTKQMIKLGIIVWAYILIPYLDRWETQKTVRASYVLSHCFSNCGSRTPPPPQFGRDLLEKTSPISQLRKI
jgi:hypothetical protein